MCAHSLYRRIPINPHKAPDAITHSPVNPHPQRNADYLAGCSDRTLRDLIRLHRGRHVPSQRLELAGVPPLRTILQEVSRRGDDPPERTSDVRVFSLALGHAIDLTAIHAGDWITIHLVGRHDEWWCGSVLGVTEHTLSIQPVRGGAWGSPQIWEPGEGPRSIPWAFIDHLSIEVPS
jgi:hypothetical protein